MAVASRANTHTLHIANGPYPTAATLLFSHSQ